MELYLVRCAAMGGGLRDRQLHLSSSRLGRRHLAPRSALSKNLRQRVRDGGHGLFWCFGASLDRLLPVVAINPEFADFFNDPKVERLTGWQSFIFSAIGIIGFVLGAVLAAAVSGLTQNS